MRCVIQRVSEASVTVAGEVTGKIGPGLMVLIGVREDDTEKDLRYMAEKVPTGTATVMLNSLTLPKEL